MATSKHGQGDVTMRGTLAAAAAAFVWCGAAFADEPIDEVKVLPLAPATPYRVWIFDLAFNHMVDGKMHVVDGKTGAYQGQVPLGFTGATAFSPDKGKLYVATTYYDRGTHGNKADVLETWDTNTLALEGEVLLPPKRAMAVTYKPLLGVTADGKWALAQNATPASSVTVVDLEGKKVAGEIDTAGCWGVFPVPSDGTRFATMCGDGTIETITLDAAGKQAKRAKSEKLFEPQKNALFIQGDAIGDRYYFASFGGDLVTIDLGPDTAQLVDSWRFIDGIEGGWRPGGYNIVAAHEASGRVYVGMHPEGAEGSHKIPAQEIWALDPAKKQVLGRTPGHNALALEVTQGEQPLVFAMKEGMALVALDPAKGMEVVNELEGVAETATMIQVP
jgi:methylamine dehydrogenase heavy chain